VPVLADPDALEVGARRLDAAAAAVREAARRLAGTGADLRWQGGAAALFREGLAEEVARLRRTAAALDEAAAALRSHAGTVRVRQRALEAAGAGLASGAAALLRGRR
jgi:uncharacterized protein YukE